ncbi:tricalbin-3 [Biomphalaria glabrata]|nr:tricalbin-3 [Biomphalaria glabrata]
MDLKTEIVYPPSWWWFPDHNIYTTFLVCLFWILLFAYFLMFRDASPTPTRQSSAVPLTHAQSSLICESVEWFNYLVKKWWKFSKQSTENLICETMNKIMSSSLPPFIDSFEVNYVDLGNKPPVIRNIRIYDSLLATLENFSLNSVRTQKVCMELDIGLPCEDFTLILSGRGVPHLVCLMLQRLYFEATVRFILTLDKEVPFPHTAKARISFKEQPYFNFGISVLGVVNLMQIPLLKTWIHSTIMTHLTAVLVEPAGLEIRFLEENSSYIH